MLLCCDATESARSRVVRIHVLDTSSGSPLRSTGSAAIRADSGYGRESVNVRGSRHSVPNAYLATTAGTLIGLPIVAARRREPGQRGDDARPGLPQGAKRDTLRALGWILTFNVPCWLFLVTPTILLRITFGEPSTMVPQSSEHATQRPSVAQAWRSSSARRGRWLHFSGGEASQ
jgi:hypothetical protein